MDLALGDEQEQLVTSFGNLLANDAPTERVRDAEETGFADGRIEHALRLSLDTTIHVGTSESPCTIIALHGSELRR